MATPLTKEGKVSREVTRKLVDFLIDGGVDGLFPLGTTGEFALLSRGERKVLVETVVDRADGRVPVFAGVSDPSTESMLGFAADAKAAGADGVIATTPYYFTTTSEALLEHYRLLSSKVDLPLMLYNIPEWTHFFIPLEVVRPLVDEGLIVGMKYTEYNWLNLLTFVTEVGDKISVFTGSDAMVYSNLEFGGAGGILGVTNVAPRIASKVFDDYEAGNLKSAREAQLRLLPIIRATSVGKFPAGLKAAMRLTGLPVGEAKEPLQRLSKEELKQVANHLKEAGLKVVG